MKYVITHAYSATNSGDGLLVDEAIQLLLEVDRDAEITVLALDPQSFEDRENVRFIHPYSGNRDAPTKIGMLLAAGRAVVRGFRLPRNVSTLVQEAGLVVGVGGGYMRGANIVEAVKMVLAHMPQLASVNRVAARAVYLPQSVGALRWGTSALLRTHGNNIVWHVRDDRSAAIVARTGIVRRTPDTAVLPLGVDAVPVENRVFGGAEPEKFGIVARSLTSTRKRIHRYLYSIRRVASALAAEPLLQARARGNNDDRFYEQAFGRNATASLIEATAPGAEDRPSVVVSVRLHGAIQSIRNGVPAIHLSYERKGWGAYEDLGIAEYVHNVFDFDPVLVARQARDLASDSKDYWAAITNRIGVIQEKRRVLLADLQAGHRL